MDVGDVVRFHDGRSWRFGVYAGEGRKWAKVNVAGHVQKIKIEDISTWPPKRASAPAKPVKRGK